MKKALSKSRGDWAKPAIALILAFLLAMGVLPATKAQAASAGITSSFTVASSNFSSPSNLVVGGDYVWVINQGASNIKKIDRYTGAVVGTTATLSYSPNKIAWDGTYAWVVFSTGGVIARIASNMAVTYSSTICTSALFNDSVSAGGGHIFMSCWNSKLLAEIDQNTLTIVQSVTGLSSIFGIRSNATTVFADEGSVTDVYTISSLTTSRVRITTNMPTNSLHQLAIDNDYMWEVGYNNGQLAKLGRIKISDNSVTIYTVSSVNGANHGPIASDGSFVYLPNSSESSFNSFDVAAGTYSVELGSTSATAVATTPGEVWAILGGALVKYVTNVQTVSWSPSNVNNSVSASPVTPSALATSNGTGAISYSVASAGTTGCTVNASTAVVTASAGGTCVIRAVAAAATGWSAGYLDVSFNFSTQAQTVTWAPTNTTAAVSAATLTPNSLASTNGTGAISYSLLSGGGTGCAVNSSTAVLTFSSAGTCVIRATAAANGSYGVGNADVSFTFSLPAQTVTWAPTNTSASFSSGTLTPSSTATSSGTGTISYAVQSAGTTGCSVNVSTAVITVSASGTCVIRATAAANASYASGYRDVSFSFAAPQVVTWAPTNTAVLVSESPLTPNSSATSNGPGAISYAVQSAGTTGCTVDSSTGVITASAMGSCVIRATAAAFGNYATGYLDVTFRFQVTQTVTWNASNTTNSLSASPVTPNSLATSDGTGTISYSVSSAGGTGCSVNASTGVITATAVGTCVVQATAASTTYYQAGSITKSFVFTAAQVVTWSPANLTNLFGSSPVTPSALATSSGTGAVSYAVQSAGTSGCQVNAATAVITASSAGICVIRATAAASGNYLAGYIDVSFNFTVVQSVTWAPTNTTNLVSASPITSATAVASGGGVISYSVISAGSSNCSVNASTGVISAVHAGLCVIRATAATNGLALTGYTDVGFTFNEVQTISWSTGSTTNAAGSNPVSSNSVPSSSGNSVVTFSVYDAGTTSCVVDQISGAVTAPQVGYCVIRATAAATGYYLQSVLDVTFTFTGAQTVTWNPTNLTNAVAATVTPNQAATTNGGGAISYGVRPASTAGCAVNASTGVVNATSVGVCLIRATAATNGAFTAGFVEVSFSFTSTQSVTWTVTNITNFASQTPVTPNQTAVSTGPGSVTYSVIDIGTSMCSVDVSTGVVTAPRDGACTIRATAAASGSYAAAYTDVTFNFMPVPASISSWTNIPVVLGQTPAISIQGDGLAKVIAVQVGFVTVTAVATATEVRFTLPKLDAGTYSYLVLTDKGLLITIADALTILPVAVKPSTGPTVSVSSGTNSALLISQVKTAFSAVVASLGAAVTLKCVAYVVKGSGAAARDAAKAKALALCDTAATAIGAIHSQVATVASTAAAVAKRKYSLNLSIRG